MAAVDASLEILVRGPDGFTIWTGPPYSNGQPGIKLKKIPCSNAKFSEDGCKLMVIKSDSVIGIYDCKSFRELRSFQVPSILGATLSPCGTYLQTFQKVSSPQENNNVILWKTETGESVYHLSQENMTTTTWPSLRFSSDEALACCMATDEIQFFDAGNFSKGILYRLKIPGVAVVELSKSPGSHVAAYVSEFEGIPASVQIFVCGKDSQSQLVAQRSFFRCSTEQLNWNSGSTGLLVVVQSNVDRTNHSYYAESKLYCLTTDGTHGAVPLSKEGHVHDAQWSCSGSEFAVVYGFMPFKATMFDKNRNPLLELGTGPYNTIRWNPKGMFLCLAGFGILSGDMVFWDCKKEKKLRTAKAKGSVTSEWSPDGRYFMTASTASGLQVDNGIKIFHRNGSFCFEKMFAKLYQAEWKPEPDIAELVNSVDSLKVEQNKIQGQGSKSSNTSAKTTSANTPMQKPAASPHAKAAEASQAELLGGGPMQEMSMSALKNKRRSESRKKAAEAATRGIENRKKAAEAATSSMRKPAASPHAKAAEAGQAELLGGGPTQEMSMSALKNKRSESRKKAAEAATSSMRKPAASPHAKAAEAGQAELLGGGPMQEMSMSALKNKRRSESRKKAAEAATRGIENRKKAAEAATSGS